MDASDAIAHLDELFELRRLEQRDGALPPALAARRLQVEARVGPVVASHPILARDLASTVRPSRKTTRRRWPGWAVPFVVAAGALGPSFDRPLAFDWLELATGPLALAVLIWGLIYPAAFAWAVPSFLSHSTGTVTRPVNFGSAASLPAPERNAPLRLWGTAGWSIPRR